MLEDITNKMKRPYCDSASAELLNLTTGIKHTINKTSSFIIGRAKTACLVIHEVYVSRHHCIITYENNVFMIYDNNATTSTYINCVELPQGKHNARQLKNGDVIGFGDRNHMTHIHKFIYTPTGAPNSKVCRKDYEHSEMTDMMKIDTEVKNVKIQSKEIRNSVHAMNTKFNDVMKTTANNLNKIIEENYGTLKKENILLKKSIEEIKNKAIADTIVKRNDLVYKVVENDFQCSICNEIMIKASTVNCSHSFCEYCIKTWLMKSSICPICRTPIKNTSNTLVVDTFITNLCDLIGGTLKDQRNNLLNERSESAVPVVPDVPVVSSQRARRGRPRNRNILPRPQEDNNQRLHVLQYPLDFRTQQMFYQIPERMRRNVEIVDLTHQGTP